MGDYGEYTPAAGTSDPNISYIDGRDMDGFGRYTPAMLGSTLDPPGMDIPDEFKEKGPTPGEYFAALGFWGSLFGVDALYGGGYDFANPQYKGRKGLTAYLSHQHRVRSARKLASMPLDKAIEYVTQPRWGGFGWTGFSVDVRLKNPNIVPREDEEEAAPVEDAGTEEEPKSLWDKVRGFVGDAYEKYVEVATNVQNKIDNFIGDRIGHDRWQGIKKGIKTVYTVIDIVTSVLPGKLLVKGALAGIKLLAGAGKLLKGAAALGNILGSKKALALAGGFIGWGKSRGLGLTRHFAKGRKLGNIDSILPKGHAYRNHIAGQGKKSLAVIDSGRSIAQHQRIIIDTATSGIEVHREAFVSHISIKVHSRYTMADGSGNLDIVAKLNQSRGRKDWDIDTVLTDQERLRDDYGL